MRQRNVSKQKADVEDFANFQRWLYSLTREELLSAMETTFLPSERMGCGSHEYDLLAEMVKLQSPPPTPVHARAVGFKERSRGGPSLGYQFRDDKSRRTRPRLFQWSARQLLGFGTNPRGKDNLSFHVIARKKVTPSGDVLSLGCTREQQEADERIVEKSYIGRRHRTGEKFLGFSDNLCSREIIRMLQVASRGNLLYPPKQTQPSISFCAAWLQPTERWFSLSCYLASRFQVSLWEVFIGQRSPVHVGETNFDKTTLKALIPRGVRLGLAKTLKQDKEELTFLRDCISWDMLENYNSFWGSGACSSSEVTLEYYSRVPLLGMHRPVSKLLQNINESMEMLIAAEMESRLLGEVDEMSQSVSEPSEAKTSRKKHKKRRKKRKKEKNQSTNHGNGARNACYDGFQTIEEEPDKVDNTVAGQTLDFPQNDTPPLQRNRHVVIALTLLEDVLQEVFAKVGLDCPNPPEADPFTKVGEAPRTVEDIVGAEAPVQILVEQGGSPRKVVGTSPANVGHGQPNEDDVKSDLHGDNLLPLDQTVVNPPDASRTGEGGFASNVDWSLGGVGGRPIADNFSPLLVLKDDFYSSLGSEQFPPGTSFNALDSWPFHTKYQARERSLLTDFFRSQEEFFDEDDKLMTASTAASISSSAYKDTTLGADADEMDKVGPESLVYNSQRSGETDEDDTDKEGKQSAGADSSQDSLQVSRQSSGGTDGCKTPDSLAEEQPGHGRTEQQDGSGLRPTDNERGEETNLNSSSPVDKECRSPSPEAPVTPPPTLSPILVSLADLRELKEIDLTPEGATRSEGPKKMRSIAANVVSGSLPNSPIPPTKNGLTLSWSREDLRIASFRDDQNSSTYRAGAVKSLAKPIASSKHASLDFRQHVVEGMLRKDQQESCAQSETAMEGHREDQHWHSDSKKHASEDADNRSTAKDESTTITSALSHREPEELATVREERNTFRDMCLTLGAEVAKLNAILAAQQATSNVTPVDYPEAFNHQVYRPGCFDPHSMSPFFNGTQRGQRLGAMSDAGIHRLGDHESQVSEDEGHNDGHPKPRTDHLRRMSSSQTIAASDTSAEHMSNTVHGTSTSFLPLYDSVANHGVQSRLAQDILRFLHATSLQLRKLDGKRRTAIERFSRLVNTLWPRAQVKLYGSHVSGLCLPSSDLDFVVCLPAVRKNAPALAPGVLEGRNAINETSQKLLARQLKGESWIDPRSIKLIERTVVPVIKVSTKDTRARMIQLDISFDSGVHHGLEANQMVTQILEELPLIRPLMLVLKQFLLDRGLLTSYTGGVSSYCLFLMVARYLQEQPASCRDCGSLLMGFLDFYGNHFDPRTTGISVRRRQYFPRPNYAMATYQEAGQGMWNPPLQEHVLPGAAPSAGPHDFLRRNSFGDAGSVDGPRRNLAPAHQRAHRFQSGTSTPHRYMPHNLPPPTDTPIRHGRPFTFDPIFVEDPLASGNNVGRNAFRIFQVQRAFSDAQRALVASLEWDIHSSGDLNDGVDYPLLKCLLQSEDVLYEL